MDAIISNKASVKDSVIGKNTIIYDYTNIYGCEIGSNCKIGAFTEVQKDVIVGNNVIISSHSFICSLVQIENDVFIGHGVMTINDLHPPSFRNTGSAKYWKKTLIKKGAVIGSNATIFPVTIGENSTVGAGSVVTKDVPPNVTVIGNPAVQIKSLENKS